MPGGTILPGYRNELLVAACRSEAVPGTIQEAQYQARQDRQSQVVAREN